MKDTCRRYGDLLCITTFSDNIRDLSSDGRSYELVLFTVPDSNERPLLVGFAVFAENVPSALSRICNDLFNIHGRTFSSILTSDSKGSKFLRKGVDEMQLQGLFKGVHLLDKKQILSECALWIEGDYQKVMDIIK